MAVWRSHVQSISPEDSTELELALRKTANKFFVLEALQTEFSVRYLHNCIGTRTLSTCSRVIKRAGSCQNTFQKFNLFVVLVINYYYLNSLFPSRFLPFMFTHGLSTTIPSWRRTTLIRFRRTGFRRFLRFRLFQFLLFESLNSCQSPPFIPPIGLRRRTGSSRDDDDGGDGDGDDANVLLVVLTGGFRVTGRFVLVVPTGGFV